MRSINTPASADVVTSASTHFDKARRNLEKAQAHFEAALAYGGKA